jgi:hypothetical protein
MTPDDLISLQLSYGRAVFEAERWRITAETLKERLRRVANSAAQTDNPTAENPDQEASDGNGERDV